MTLSKARFVFLWPFYLQVFLVNFCLRLLLTWQEGNIWWSELPGILFWGLVQDTLFFSYFAIPFVIYLWFTPGRLFIHASNKGTLHLLNALSSFFLVILAFFEYGFWQAHHCRFNEIAAQSLLKDGQFIGTALRGENLFILIPLVILFGGILWLMTSKLFNYYLKKQEMVYSNFRFRLLPALFFIAIPCLAFYSLEYKQHTIMPVESSWAKEQLQHNGSYQLAHLIYQKKLFQK